MTIKTVKLEVLPEEISKEMEISIQQYRQGVISGLYRAIPMLVRKSPVDTGLYAQSWDVEVTDEAATIGNYAPHAPIIELGARPFTPPLPPLLAWAKRVLRDPSQPPNYSSEVWALAKGVQKKIAERGIAPRMIMSNSLEEIISLIREELDKVV
jgi:hypothetical protein